MSTSLTKIRVGQQLPRIPFKATIDLTYRCNNDCRHCWVRLDPRNTVKKQELSTKEIFDIVDQARELGCREWGISGGEPMLRPDFYEIFDYITRKSRNYSLNTNGTLITPRIAKLMKERKGAKMVALYGASKEVYEDVSRVPGTWEAAMRGFRLLKEAGASFIVQVIPMKANYHELDKMIALAEELSPVYRIGAPWLYLRADGDEERNAEIRAQRLPARTAVELDPPPVRDNDPDDSCGVGINGHIYANCIESRREFFIDPYGRMTHCSFIRDPKMMYDLRQGSVRQAWEEFIPGLKTCCFGGEEYLRNCGRCEYRDECRWCGVYAYLEHGRHSARVDYLCKVARETRSYKKEWIATHRRYFDLAGLTIQFESDLPIEKHTIHPDLQKFMVDEPGDAVVKVQHHFDIPKVDESRLGRLVKKEGPWKFYQHEQFGVSAVNDYRGDLYTFVTISKDWKSAHIYHRDDHIYDSGELHILTYSLREVTLLAHTLIDMNACYFHSSAFVYKDRGFLFLGHSGAGKSTMIKLMRDHVTILCDETNIIKREADGYKVYGTWNHGELPEVSNGCAPLAGIFVLKQAKDNSLRRLSGVELVAHLVARNFKSIYVDDLLNKQLNFFEEIARDVPAFELSFDRSGKVKEVLDLFLRKQ